MPEFSIPARAETTPTSLWVTITGAAFTSTILLGPSPTPTPPPAASSSPSRGTVIGAIVGSIFGFLLLLFLIWAFVRTSRSNWVPHDRGSIDEVYVANPNVAPAIEKEGAPACRVFGIFGELEKLRSLVNDRPTELAVTTFLVNTSLVQMSKTYFLVPTRDTVPSGSIFLGSIIKSPYSPELSINGKNSHLLSALEVIETRLVDTSQQLSKSGKGKTGVWAEFLGGMGIGADISGTWDNTEESTYKFSELITKTISPSLSEIQAIFKEPEVQQCLKDSRFRNNLYMIIGIKIARGADVAISRIRARGGNLNFGIDMTPFGVPIKVGPEFELSREVGHSVEEKHTNDFVFAYRLREIRYRRKTVEDQREYRKGDLMGAGQRNKNGTDGDESTAGVGAEVGLEDMKVDQEEEAELIGLGNGDVDGDGWAADTTSAVDEDGEEVQFVLLEDDDD
ncbi:hypothetical protein ONS95_012810 [Cadophora gregata]|uniref:uncharacterized protein n=1 Tax=Cadophora gregata TaxID=51156 RepID=UPI0026DBAD26|nr:uncharacterized protein ONS95_012810 [Cadophora gregata]KAK0101209.1 hypothetical protein ONS96_006431 [Cadophora gregata f. sp. sojae]KAK0115756.1 hypothetical protein ONS95_012810 [Cadophora gregata]